MRLTYAGIADRTPWDQAGIILPSYDAEAAARRTVEAPVWAHFGVGNIFRVFLGGIADQLLSRGAMDRGITCVECYDGEVVDRIYRPYDNLGLSVILHADGREEKRVLGSMCEAIKAAPEEPGQMERLREVFRAESLQLVSFTITEKGYALTNTAGAYFGAVRADLDNGPDAARTAMGIVTAMLWARFLAGGAPLALVSMDNCSQNGSSLRASVLQVAQAWRERGFVGEDFLAWVGDEGRVAFPWTMIDKITPRPSEAVAERLEALGLEGMEPIVTGKQTYIAPFVNAEGPQYLVIEDSFPNGRPPLELAGVYMTDRATVNKSERMKVTACLNPIHSALGPFGCLLGFTLFSDQMRDADSLRLAHAVGEEGMDTVPDPGILSPRAFLEECLNERFPNPYLGDTVQRLVTDISQGVGVRFGETVKAYQAKYGSAQRLRAIPLAIAGWLRYLLAVDDKGHAYELSPDPMNAELQALLADVRADAPATLTGQLKPILSDTGLFGVNLYEAGIGEQIETLFRQMLAGPGSVRRTLHEAGF